MDVAADTIDQVLLMNDISLEGVQEHFIRSLRYKASLVNAQVVTMGLLNFKIILDHPIDYMWMSTRPMAITGTDHITVDPSNGPLVCMTGKQPKSDKASNCVHVLARMKVNLTGVSIPGRAVPDSTALLAVIT